MKWKTSKPGAGVRLKKNTFPGTFRAGAAKAEIGNELSVKLGAEGREKVVKMGLDG
jgi:hypothetical protein